MGEDTGAMRRTIGKRSGKFLAGGTTGLIAAFSFMLVLVPAGAGAAHPAILLKAPYKGTGTIPSTYLSSYGCGTTKALTPKWSGVTGVVHMSDSATAPSCKQVGPFGSGGGSAYMSASLEILIPFKVATTGNHSVASSWAVKIASTHMSKYGGCPAKNVNYFQTLYHSQTGECYSSSYLDLYFDSYVIDLSNSSWYGTNYSYASGYNSSYFQNYTYCYNYGTPSCSNSTYSSNYSSAYSNNAPGWAAFVWNGGTTFTAWTNSTAMNKADKFALLVYVSVYGSVNTVAENLLMPWPAVSAASVNMATLGNGATLSSVTIT
jgi:hypothetical protein